MFINNLYIIDYFMLYGKLETELSPYRRCYSPVVDGWIFSLLLDCIEFEPIFIRERQPSHLL